VQVGNYTLSGLLGRGGTSEVYAATHRLRGDAVALKLLRRALADDDALRDAFLAEAVRTREIQHPNVVRVLEVGHDDASGSCYLVMERIDGESLAARLARCGQLPEADLRRLCAAIADGMAAAHARGVVHRDLKPGNVMLRGDVPTIVDFGIAKSLGATSAVVTERRVGTVAYMAPEQLTDGLIAPAVDIWALGVVMYETATGKLPFGSFTGGRLPQLFDTPPRAATLAPISPALDDLIARCLERDPGKRPAAMADIARALRSDDDERVTADVGAVASVPLASSAPRRRQWPLVVVLSASVAVAATVTAVLASKVPSPPPAPAASVPPDAEPIAVPVESPTVPDEPPTLPDEPPTLPDAPIEHAAPPPTPRHEQRPKPRAKPTKPRTTSQGETLD